MAIRNAWEGRFAHKSMQEIMSYLLTQNMESQAVVAAGAETEIDDTGTKAVMINGEIIALPVDNDYESGTDVCYADWAASTAYSVAGLVSEVVQDGRHFVCILAHTSYAYDYTSASCVIASSNQPLHGATWQTYWRELDVWAEDMKGDVIPIGNVTGQTRYYLICACASGNLRGFKAYSGTGTATLQIPAYDPTRWCPVALIKIVSADAGTMVIGTDNWNEAGVTTTVQQLTGPVFPDVLTSDKN